ncbi:hypothetical protein SDC9_61092 [bioreactor metagenome]|uniref:ADP-ribosylglycohydrolase n=1 Tax=bioreactor metagenome TaxID=1076179 RepID=A0A644XG34_9ZZZZ
MPGSVEGGIGTIGAIAGDIVGSRFEFRNCKDKEFELFTGECRATDDSVMTIAAAKAIMEAKKRKNLNAHGNESDREFYTLLENETIRCLRQIGRRYPDCGYGRMFSRWLWSDDPRPYNSFGNGAAMRVSPAGFAAQTESEAVKLAQAVTSVTHNHAEGLRGAEAVAVTVFMARHGFTKAQIREKITACYYPLDFTIDEIRDDYMFDETCQKTVPQALEAFLEASSFEDALRTAISLGGDSDTLAAITGAAAEAFYGVPDAIRIKALSYLDAGLLAIYEEWRKYIP